MIEPVEFIRLLRESFYGSEYVYTRGSCYQLFRLLAAVYPEAEPYYANDHVITKLGDRFYDITGEVSGEGYRKHTEADGCHDYRFSLWGTAWECPNCDEIIDYGTLLKERHA